MTDSTKRASAVGQICQGCRGRKDANVLGRGSDREISYPMAGHDGASAWVRFCGRCVPGILRRLRPAFREANGRFVETGRDLIVRRVRS